MTDIACCSKGISPATGRSETAEKQSYIQVNGGSHFQIEAAKVDAFLAHTKSLFASANNVLEQTRCEYLSFTIDQKVAPKNGKIVQSFDNALAKLNESQNLVNSLESKTFSNFLGTSNNAHNNVVIESRLQNIKELIFQLKFYELMAKRSSQVFDAKAKV